MIESELSKLILSSLSSQQFMTAAKLAAEIEDVDMRELWFDQITEAQVAAYERCEERRFIERVSDIHVSRPLQRAPFKKGLTSDVYSN